MHKILLGLVLAVACQSHLAAALFGRTPKTCPALLAAYKKDLGKHRGASALNDNFVFFLHVPRTAGKTYATCMLRPATPPSKRCTAAYDGLKMNISQEGCTVLASHDDFSIMEVSAPHQHHPSLRSATCCAGLTGAFPAAARSNSPPTRPS